MSNTWTHSEDKKLIEHIRDNFADGKVIASYMASDLGRTEASIEGRISLIRRYWRGDVVLSALPRGLAEALAEAGKPATTGRRKRKVTGRKYPVYKEPATPVVGDPDRGYQAVVVSVFAFVIALSALIFSFFGGL